MIFSARSLRQLIETLLIAAAGGVSLEMLGLPAGLVSGSVLAVAVAALAGRPVMMPVNLTRGILAVVGIALGSVVTPETLSGLVAYPGSIAVLVLATLCIMVGTAFYLRAVHRWSVLTALLAASPGALSQVMALSAESDVDVPAITVVQTMRVIILAAGLPVGLSLLGVVDGPPIAEDTPTAAGSIGALAFLISVSGLAAFLLFNIRFPGAWIFGAMLGSGTLHGMGWTNAHLPWWIADTAMITLGAVTGSRFAGTPPRLLAKYLAGGFGSFAVSVLTAGCFMAAVINLLDFHAADVAIAFAPGAQETMMLLALALRLDPVFVGAHHLARFMIVSLCIPVLASAILRKNRPMA